MGREERGWERVDRIVYRGMKGWGRSFSRARVLALQCCCPLLLSWYWSEFYPCPLGTALPINELHALCINQHWCCTSVVDVARILIRWFASPARGHCMICNNTKTCRLAPPAPDISVAMMMVVTTRFLFYLFCALLTWVVTGYCGGVVPSRDLLTRILKDLRKEQMRRKITTVSLLKTFSMRILSNRGRHCCTKRNNKMFLDKKNEN